MDEQPLITRWSEVESWLQGEARDCVRGRSLPPSVAIAFHDGHISALMETPTFTVEDAELITEELCRFLPQLQADQLLVIWPAAFGPDPDGMPTIWTLRAMLGERDHGWRTLLYPLPFDQPDEPIEPIEVDVVDPWSARIRRVFDMPVPPVHTSVLVTPADERFMVAFHPEGRFATTTTLFGFN